MIRSLIFDFGGTIDTDGIHWIEKFWSVYQKHSISITKDQFIEAYIYAERRMNDRTKPADTFRTTLLNQLSLQFEYLQNKDLLTISKDHIENIRDECYSGVKKCISQFVETVENFRDKFSFALVSNFYGNLEAVLREFDIYHYFKVIIDSTLVKIRKPDSNIFLITLRKLSSKPGEAVVIGDSYENDIVPSKKIGCSTIWLHNKTYIEQKEVVSPDFKISSIKQLSSILNKIN